MTRRKGELHRSRLDREFPHHVALPAEAVRGLAKADAIRRYAGELGGALLTYSLRGEAGGRVVFCLPDRRTRRPSPSGSAGSCCR